MAEEQLAQTVHGLPNEEVVLWGKPIGARGSDVVSVNPQTGGVTLWDARFRSASVRIQPSRTFQQRPTLQNAIKEATEAVQRNQTLPAHARDAALRNLQAGEVRTRTVGFGNAKNPTLQ